MASLIKIPVGMVWSGHASRHIPPNYVSENLVVDSLGAIYLNAGAVTADEVAGTIAFAWCRRATHGVSTGFAADVDAQAVRDCSFSGGICTYVIAQDWVKNVWLP